MRSGNISESLTGSPFDPDRPVMIKRKDRTYPGGKDGPYTRIVAIHIRCNVLFSISHLTDSNKCDNIYGSFQNQAISYM